MFVIKRNGSKEEFSTEKIKSAMLKAFQACNFPLSEKDKKDVSVFLDNIEKEAHEDISVEDIQNKVEKYLCKRWFPVGKAYMLYRKKHTEARIIKDKVQYIHKYNDSESSATNLSNTDDNANTINKNAATLEGELYKDTSRLVQRSQMKELLAEINSPYRDQYIKDLEHHIFYQHDESCPILKPYCSAYTLYPLLVDGTDNIDGTKNHAPHHLSSFCGQFQNLVFLLSAQKKGAGAYGEFFNFFSYFCEKEWGKEYYKKEDVIITNEHCLEQKTIGQTIDQFFQSITHYINQPAGNRGYQSPFTNFNVFDSYYWHAMFDDFYFPDGSKPNWDAVNWLQKRYIRWLNKERTETILTFPVVTVCCLTNDNDALDKEYKDFITTQWAEGDSLFAYLSKNADSISSCCRLRNEVTDNTFSSTTGLTGVQTGSCNVMTLNLNRIIQDCNRSYGIKQHGGFTISNNKEYLDFASWVLNVIKQYNRQHSSKKFMFNLELVPAESLGVKNYNWDKEDGYWVPSDKNLYNSYIYDAHDDTSILDKIAMQGGQIAQSIDGGQASHLNLEDNLSKEQYTKLLEYAIKVGNNYITFNVPQTQCDDCKFIAKHPFYVCPKCGSHNTTLWTRVIGYLKPMKSWSESRQQEGSHRMFAKKNEVC